ncbi:D-alanyl-D-alanine carboxypeptidase family protein [Faucicola boevrei]|uniref:D-alanyl-D-alanine carboxypeptidase family protein n=1 Tax=Faucicola boevrei TaxID=346665 RepID=UPI00036EC442|nr:D-alanyl-D-alanine carboxypeptidase family protein [Moraxella boevrei]
MSYQSKNKAHFQQKIKVGLKIGLVASALSVFGMGNAYAIDAPTLDNTAYILIDYDTGTVLAQKNANQPFPPASLTKMMTSYIIEQQLLSGKLQENQPVMMTEDAWCRGRNTESCMYVPVNTTATALDMLKGIIIQSGNDAAKAMAQHIAGSEQAFAELMNTEAKKLGMTNTHFVNATGMPAEGHQASPQDLAKLAQAIIKDAGKYYPIYSQKQFTYNKITQPNRNTLLFTDNTVDGLKTGHTKEAGFCLVASSKRGDMRLISVIMGTKSEKARAEQSKELLNWGFGHFNTKVVAPMGQSFGDVAIKYGQADNVTVKAGSNLQVLLEKINQDNIQTVVNLPKNVEAPIQQGQQVGEVIAMLNGKAVASAPLVADVAVEKSGIFKRIWQYITGLFG